LGIAGVLGALGIGLGAFGGHLLRPVLPLTQMTVFETAVRYHLFHTLALLGTALAMHGYPGDAPALRRVAWLFTAGVTLFSGSLYLVATTDLRWLSALTPLGGVALAAGWLGVAVVFLRRR
jgi:uncharacterized membrane protein YgdD (TMEM256/DUF423 family)